MGSYPSPQNCIVLDIETTGLDALKDRVIEIYAVQLGPDFEKTGEFYSMIRYEGILPPIITKLTGIETETLREKGQPAAEVFPAFKKFLGHSILVGHNIDQFDLPFIRAELNRIGEDILNGTFDTLIEGKKAFKFYSYRLEKMAESLNIPHERMHNARSDVNVTVELFRKILGGGG